MSHTAGNSRTAQRQAARMGRAPYAVLLLRFERAVANDGADLAAPGDPSAQLAGLQIADMRIAACDSLDEARHAVERFRPIAGFLHFGARLDAAAVETTLALAQAAPRLRLIALIEPALAQSAALAKLVGKGLIHDYHTLPICRDRLMFSLGHIAGLVALEDDEPRAALAAGDRPEQQIIGASPRLLHALRAIRKFAAIEAPVVITGEAGTGKELAARAVHYHSPRRDGPFVAVSCAGLPTRIIEAELFGHERGAFAGAIRQKIGRIEAARGGTLFLDEVGDLPLEVQGQLLQFLEERKIKRRGGSRSIAVDARIITASRAGLEETVRAGRFRADLHHQLNVLAIEMPPLRERGDDVQLLATYFLRSLSNELKLPKLGFHDGALEKLQRHRWPDNVRELISAIRRAVVMADGRWITAADITFDDGADGERVSLPDLTTARRQLEDKLVRDALRINGGNIKRAAKELGVSRVTFYRLMEKHRIRPDGAHGARPVVPRPLPPLPRPSFRRAGMAGPGPMRSGGRKIEDDGRSSDLT